MPGKSGSARALRNSPGVNPHLNRKVETKGLKHNRRFALDGVGQSIWEGLRQQIYLGDAAFVERMQEKAKIEGDALTIPQAQHRPPAPPLSDIAARHTGRNPAIVAAYASGAYSYREIAEHFGDHLKCGAHCAKSNATK